MSAFVARIQAECEATTWAVVKRRPLKNTTKVKNVLPGEITPPTDTSCNVFYGLKCGRITGNTMSLEF